MNKYKFPDHPSDTHEEVEGQHVNRTQTTNFSTTRKANEERVISSNTQDIDKFHSKVLERLDLINENLEKLYTLMETKF